MGIQVEGFKGPKPVGDLVVVSLGALGFKFWRCFGVYFRVWVLDLKLRVWGLGCMVQGKKDLARRV